MGFKTMSEIAESYNTGKVNFGLFYKTLPNGYGQPSWFDISAGKGYPSANYFAANPAVGALFDPKIGINTGPEILAEQDKFIKKISFTINTYNGQGGVIVLADMLMFYPFIDMDDTTPQTLDNNVTLPRYDTGDGVMAYLVCQGSTSGGSLFNMNYTDSEGNVKDTLNNATTNVATYGIVNVGSAPFIKLGSGSKGIRRVNSITFQTPNGGIAAIVLCKPLGNLQFGVSPSQVEKDFAIEGSFTLPKLYPGACVTMLGCVSTNIGAATFMGTLETIWR